MNSLGERRGCYCCSKPSNSGTSMDIDAALNELGMLSAVTESRKQYLRECSVLKNQEEPSCSQHSISPSCPPSSPSKGYRIVHINPMYVTSVLSEKPEPDIRRKILQEDWKANAATCKYGTSALEYEASLSRRLSRIRLARMKRFKKPYEVPWRHSMVSQHYRNGCQSLAQPSTSSSLDNPGRSSQSCASNCSTPEKDHPSGKAKLTRSRSLDELEFAQLKLSETENHNFFLEKKEIERMSQHLKNLQV